MKRIITKREVEATLTDLRSLIGRVANATNLSGASTAVHEVAIPKFYSKFCETLSLKPSIVTKKLIREYSMSNLNAKKTDSVPTEVFLKYTSACYLALNILHENEALNENDDFSTDEDAGAYALVLVSMVSDFISIFQDARMQNLTEC